MSQDAVLGLILAGGEGRRMGNADKALVRLQNQPLIAHVYVTLLPQVSSVAVSANGDGSRFAAAGALPPEVPVLADASPDQGPLAGVLAGLVYAESIGAEALCTTAVDTPFFPEDLVAQLRGSDGISVATSAGRQHPTFALWPVGTADSLRAYLDMGERRMMMFIQSQAHHFVEFPENNFHFSNINTAGDLMGMEAEFSL